MESQTSQQRTRPSCHCPSSSPAERAPRWLRDGRLLEDELKDEIGRCTEKLSAEPEGDETRQAEGAEQLFSTMMHIWGLETGEISRRAADIACDEIR